jgi:colanic acid biosynthesis glycosyl transferase WcaI
MCRSCVLIVDGSTDNFIAISSAEPARLLAPRCPQLVFVLCGDGVMKEPLREATAALANVQMLPLQPQDPDVADLVMPSKLTAMLSSGRAVVSTAKPGSEVAEVVGHCGLLSEPGSADALAAALQRLAGDAELRARCGQAARAYAVAYLGTEQVLGRFVAECEALRGGRAEVAARVDGE